MFKKLICMLLCLTVALCALPLRYACLAQGANTLRADLNGDGRQEEISCVTQDLRCTIRIGDTEYTEQLNDSTNTYILAVADLDTSDAFIEIVIGNEGNSGEYPASTTWQVLRYDGKRIYPLTVETAAGEADSLMQYGYAGDSMTPLKSTGQGEVLVPSKGVIWISPWMREYAFSDYEECYLLEGDRLVLQSSDQLYPVSVQESALAEVQDSSYAAARDIMLYAQTSRAGDTVTVPAGTVVTPVEASPSGWLCLRADDGTQGYLWQEPGWNECLDAGGQNFSDAVEYLEPGQTPSVMPASESAPVSAATPRAESESNSIAVGFGSNGKENVTLEQARADFYTGRNRFGASGDGLFYDRILNYPENYFMCLTAKEAVGGWQSNAAIIYDYIVSGELQDIAEYAQEGMFEKLVLLDILSSYADVCYQDTSSFDLLADSFKEFVDVSGSVDDLLNTLSDMEGILPENFDPAAASLFINLYDEGADWANALSNYLNVYAQRQQYIELLQGIRAANPDKYMTKAIDDIINMLENESVWEGTGDIYLQMGKNVASTIVLTIAEELFAKFPQVKAVLAARKLTGTIVNQFFDFSEFNVQMRTAEVLRRYETALVQAAKQANADYLRDASQENALRVCMMFDVVYRSLFYDLDAYEELADVFGPSEASQNIDDMRGSLRSSYDAVQSMDYALMRDRLNGENGMSAPNTPDVSSDSWQDEPETPTIPETLPDTDPTETLPDTDPTVTWRGDFDKDGVEEAFYLGGADYDRYAERTIYTQLWYADASGSQYLESTQAINFSLGRVYDVGDCLLFCVEDNYTAVSQTHVWTVRDGSPERIYLASGQQPSIITQEDGQDFFFTFDAYDRYSNGSGHTWKHYYMYWNGNGFTEYGGLRITEAQLRAVEGASRWLDEIIASGGVIGDIFYRENGIVNINYITSGGWTDGTVNNKNATLRISGGIAELVYSEEETLDGSDDGGVYAASVLGNASFPDAFPYTPAQTVSDLPEGYRMLAESHADLDGDGMEEKLSFCLVSEDYGDTHIALCVFRPTGEMIQDYGFQSYTPYSNYTFRAFLLPAEGRQRIFLESISIDGDAPSKRYMLLGFSDGVWTEEVTVHDYGFSEGVGLYGVFAPGEEERELFYDTMAGSQTDWQDAYLMTLQDTFGNYNIFFQIAKRDAFYKESYGTVAYGPFSYFAAVLPTEAIWQWEYAPVTAAQTPEDVTTPDGGLETGGETDAPSTSTGVIFAQYEEYAPWGEGEEGAPLVAVDAGAQRWSEYEDALGGFVRLGGMSASCSSYRASNKYPCDASCAFDGDMSTSWNSDSARSGQWLRVEWPKSQTIVGFTIVNGYAKDDSVWQNNSRVQVCSVYVNGEDYLGSFFLDDTKQTQYFPLDGGIDCNGLLFQFDETYGGDKYNDLCVTEIQFYGYAADTNAITSGEAAQEGIASHEPSGDSATSVQQAVYTTGNVNIRTGPGRGYTNIGTVPKGTTVTYLGQSDYDERGVEWFKIRYHNTGGWISSKYARLTRSSIAGQIQPTPSYADTYVKAVSGDTYLRTGPGLSYDRLSVLHRGKQAKYLGETSTDSRGVNWYKVRFGNHVGWVSSKYTKFC